MSKVGQISTQEGKEDYSKLLSALDSADEVELAKEVRAMIEKRTEERRYINSRCTTMYYNVRTSILMKKLCIFDIV